MISEAFLKKMKENLLLQKKELIDRTDHNINVDTDGDETDEIQAHMLLELAAQLNTRNSAKLSQIDDALKRISEHTYGYCQDCEDPIPNKRLLANPYFLTCVNCAEERETEEKQKKRF